VDESADQETTLREGGVDIPRKTLSDALTVLNERERAFRDAPARREKIRLPERRGIRPLPERVRQIEVSASRRCRTR